MRLLSYWWATLLAVRNSFKPPDQFFDSCSEYCTMDCPSTLTTSQQNWDSLNSQCSESLPRQKFLPFKKNTQLRRPWDMFWLRTPLSQSFPSSSCVSASVGFALQQTTGAWSLQYKESRRFLSTMDSLSVNRLIWFYFCFRICRWIPIKYCCRVLGGYDSPSSLRASVLNQQSHFASKAWLSVSRMSPGTLLFGKRRPAPSSGKVACTYPCQPWCSWAWSHDTCPRNHCLRDQSWTACWSVGCPLCRCWMLNIWNLLPML